MSKRVAVGLDDRAYDIRIEEGSLDRVGEACRICGLGDFCLLVSDSNVDPLYGDRAAASLSAAGIEPVRSVFPAGEASKHRGTLFCVLEQALDRALDRRSFFLALGGGVVGDVAGFAASIYLRGVDCVQAPTSLLAMVDSSVGGKTGIDMPQGKNLVGCFYQPRAVIIDPATLDTLPEREFRAGMAEVIKYGVIADMAFFEYLEDHHAELQAARREVMENVIARCCEIKAEVVRRDERETGGVRAILNFGHTLGHAVEAAAGYGAYLHGEAVAIGMAYAAALSVKQSGLSADEAKRIRALIAAAGLPVRAEGLAWADLAAHLRVDKKSEAGIPRFVLAEHIGQVRTGCRVDEAVLREAWDECCQ